MPLDYHIDTDSGLINLTGQDRLEISDLVRCGEALLEDQAFDPTLPQLLDLREAEIAAPDGLTYEPDVLAFIERFNQQVRAGVAVIVPGGLEKSIIAEVYRATCQFARAELFEDYDHAMRWLIKTEFAAPAVSASGK